MERSSYELQLEMLERNSALGDRAAMDLLASEFTLAQNAGRFDALSSEDIEFTALARSTPQEGVTRFTVALTLVERRPQLAEDDVSAMLEQAFTSALNASYFLRVCTDDDVTLRLRARASAVDGALRPAA